jgi:hypothetical protein
MYASSDIDQEESNSSESSSSMDMDNVLKVSKYCRAN